ncbi:CLUMA_CG007196, isoform A [Clunio marinus]|uniref:CLUMA_CG007196, isoform A n=1 Tax=Clunio marinus TaxID=568069 RepID=A0A1J1I0E0_9DIPT|nr:CLUMA_CG007196, isoform A [Clunio marinus]
MLPMLFLPCQMMKKKKENDHFWRYFLYTSKLDFDTRRIIFVVSRDKRLEIEFQINTQHLEITHEMSSSILHVDYPIKTIEICHSAAKYANK